ncbi:MAG: ACP S-malonyltransferase [Promicromonosporaceae bacterium]|nr:ACP S-malonyltransferase [Promicromonosporaceae bacterium]
MLAILCPGQGSQSPGMLTEWLQVPGAREILARFSEVAGLDLIHLGTDANADEIRATEVAQPLIVATSLLSFRLAEFGSFDTLNHRKTVVAGHSLGAVTAGAIVGVYDDDDAVRLAAMRGRLMAEAGSAAPSSGMSALTGRGALTWHDDGAFRAAYPNLEIAGVNSPEQIILAGPLAELGELAANPPPGLRVTPLPVSAAFHTALMTDAAVEFRRVLEGFPLRPPRFEWLSDLDGSPLGIGGSRGVIDYLATQITSPIRWDLVLNACARRGVDTAIITAPSSALAALTRRGLPSAIVEPLCPTPLVGSGT